MLIDLFKNFFKSKPIDPYTVAGAVVGGVAGAVIAGPAVLGTGWLAMTAIAGVGAFFGAQAGTKINVAIMQYKRRKKAGLIFPDIVITRSKDEVIDNESRLVLNYTNVVIFDQKAIEHATLQQTKSDAEVVEEYSLEHRPKFNVKFAIKKGTTLGEIEYSDVNENPAINITITTAEGDLITPEDDRYNEILATLEVMPKLLGGDLVQPEVIADEVIEETSKMPLVNYARALFFGKVNQIKVNPLAAPSDELDTNEFLDGLISIAIKTKKYDILQRHKQVLLEQYAKNFAAKIKQEEIDAAVKEEYYGRPAKSIIIGALVTVALVALTFVPGINILATAVCAGAAAYYTVSRAVSIAIGFFKKKRQLREKVEFHNKTMRKLTEKYDGLNDIIEAVEAVKNKDIALTDKGINDTYIGIISKNICSADCKVITVDLSNNRITSIGAANLAAALKKGTKIAKLNLSGNAIKDDGVEAIIVGLLENFTVIELSHDKVSEENQLAVKKQLAINKYLQGVEISAEEKQLFGDEAGYITAIISKIKAVQNPECLLAIAYKNELALDVKAAWLSKRIEFIMLKDTLVNQISALKLFLETCKQDPKLLKKPIIDREKLLVWTRSVITDVNQVSEDDLKVLLDLGFNNHTKAILVCKVINSAALKDKSKQKFLDDIFADVTDDKNIEIFLNLIKSDIYDNKCSFLKTLEEAQLNELFALCFKNNDRICGITALIYGLVQAEKINGPQIIKNLFSKAQSGNGDKLCLLDFDSCIKKLQDGNELPNQIIQNGLQVDLKARFACLRGESNRDFEALTKELRSESIIAKQLTEFDFVTNTDKKVENFIQNIIYLNKLSDAKTINEFVDFYSNEIPAESKQNCLNAIKKMSNSKDKVKSLFGVMGIADDLQRITDNYLRTKILEICIGDNKYAYSKSLVISKLISNEKIWECIDDNMVYKLMNSENTDACINLIQKLKIPANFVKDRNEIVHFAIEQKIIAEVENISLEAQEEVHALDYIKRQLSNNFELTEFKYKFKNETLDSYIDFICQRNEAYRCAKEHRLGDFVRIYNKIAVQSYANQDYKTALLENQAEFLKFVEKNVNKDENFADLKDLNEEGKKMISENYSKNHKQVKQSGFIFSISNWFAKPKSTIPGQENIEANRKLNLK